MIKIRIEGSHEECLAAADKIRRAGIAKIHVQSKFYPNRGSEQGRIYLELEFFE